MREKGGTQKSKHINIIRGGEGEQVKHAFVEDEGEGQLELRSLAKRGSNFQVCPCAKEKELER